MNSDLGTKHAIEYRQSGTGIVNIQNVYVINVTQGTDTKIIKTQSLLTFYLKNGTFIAVEPQDLGDSTSKLVDLSTIVLTDQYNFTIEDVFVQN